MTVAAGAGWVAAALAIGVWLVVARLSAARMEAVARACHELRGPLTAARLGLELGSHGPGLSVAQLQAIGSELGRATLALDDLSYAREGRIPIAQTAVLDLAALLGDSVRAWRPVAARAGVALRLEGGATPATVAGDRRRLAQAVGNLIANAVEHGGEDVEVRYARVDEVVRIEIADDGPGLPASVDALARRPRRGRGARGRGLAIACGVAELHRGRLEAAPVGRGACLVLTLPAAPDLPRDVRGVAAGRPRSEAGRSST